MTPLDTAINATLLLSLALGLLALLRRSDAASKHLLCAVTLALVVLLPVVGALPFQRPPAVLNLAIAQGSIPLDGEFPEELFLWLWACGAGFVALRFAAGIASLAWLTRRASACVIEGLPSHRVDMRYADVSTPLVWGWLRPTILLPSSFRNWPLAARQAAIHHELAHIRRGDSWTTLLVTAAQALYWFHPLVWRLSGKLVEQRELAATIA